MEEIEKIEIHLRDQDLGQDPALRVQDEETYPGALVVQG
jgi:hypothetical protein